MKRIAFISQSLYGGGQERVTVNLANALSENRDYQIYILSGEKQEREYLLSDSVIRDNIFNGKVFRDAIVLRKYLKINNIDIAVGMGIYSNFVACISNFFQKTKIIISERNDPAHDRLSFKSKLFRFIFYRFADRYVFQTEGARSFYSNRIQVRGKIIPNPVRENLPYKSGICNKEIVSVGRLSPQKNYHNLLKAFSIVVKKYPEYKLRIFGEGELKNELIEYCYKLSLSDCVIFEGFSTDVHNEIIDSDIFVMSSDYEGMPNALMEAMAMGFPCVSTDCPCGGPNSLINDGINGMLVSVGNSNELANSIIQLIENHNKKSIISMNAIKIRETYSKGEILKLWQKVLK